jgi:hypothetical protein
MYFDCETALRQRPGEAFGRQIPVLLIARWNCKQCRNSPTFARCHTCAATDNWQQETVRERTFTAMDVGDVPVERQFLLFAEEFARRHRGVHNRKEQVVVVSHFGSG